MTAEEDDDAVAVEEPQPKSADPGALENFELSKGIVDALAARGIEKLFPIQVQTFNHVLSGKDVMARAKTGSGKTLVRLVV